MTNQIKVAMVEDNQKYQEVIDFALKLESKMDLVHNFGTAETAIQYFKSEDRDLVDVILLDLNLPGMSGLDAISELTTIMPDTKIIILSQSDCEEDVVTAIAQGASGYLLKSSTIDDIREGISTVHSGEAFLDVHIAKYLVSALQQPTPKTEKDKILSKREMEILNLLAEGLQKKEISKKLFISYPTVDSHVKNIYDKLRVNNAPSAIHKAHKIGLFGPPLS